jgi:hypothetical protein
MVQGLLPFSRLVTTAQIHGAMVVLRDMRCIYKMHYPILVLQKVHKSFSTHKADISSAHPLPQVTASLTPARVID